MRVPMLTTDFLDRAVDLYDDQVGVIAHDGTQFTYAEFGERVNRLSNALVARGLEAGDKVALLGPNDHWYLEAMFATNQIGLVSVPMNYRLTGADYRYILDDSGADALIVDYEYADVVEPVLADTPVEHLVCYESDRMDGTWEDYEAALAEQPATPPERPTIEEDDPATINYTSGTTGDPKGVVRTHRTEHYHALSVMLHTGVRDDDTYLWTLPMFHVNGWGFTYMITGIGGTHVCQRTFDAADTYDRIRTYDVSLLCGAPTVLNRLIEHYESNAVDTEWNTAITLCTAASPPPEATIRTVEDELGWSIVHMYGLTETSPMITTSNSPKRIAQEGRFAVKPRQGHSMIGAEVRVVDEDGQDVPHDDETIGEIVVRGNQVMDRYLNKPEKTEEAFSDRVDGFFHTGDLATVNEHGMVAIRDRKKNIIISGGENISSVEVEDCLYDHPDIAKVAVVGVSSEEWGETPLAVVVPKHDADLSEEEVIEFAKENLASFKAPTEVRFEDDVPETATGKVQKYELRDRFDE